MPKYALDSNVYISAFRDPPKTVELQRFLAASLSLTYLLAAVAQELRAGVQTRRQLAAFDDIVGPFARRRRLIAPSAAAYIEGGRILSELRGQAGPHATSRSSFINDVMIAVSCRENGITLVTENAAECSGFFPDPFGAAVVCVR